MTLIERIKFTFKTNLYPALILQVVALGLLFGYYNVELIAAQLQYLADIKTRFGILYSAVATAVFGAILPSLFRFLLRSKRNPSVLQVVFLTLVWALLGFVVDYLYQWQAIWFGNDSSWVTIAQKTAVDQFLFSAFISCPFITVCYLFHDNHFDWQKTRSQLGMSLFTLHIPATVVTNWLIWIPAVAVIYSMPLSLQLPFFNIVLCFFALVIASLNRCDTI